MWARTETFISTGAGLQSSHKKLSQPCNVAVDINGQMEDQYTGEITSPRQYYESPPIHAFFIHGNPVLTNKPATNRAGVYLATPGTIPPQTGSWTTIYFLPGVHYIGTNFQVYPGKSAQLR